MSAITNESITVDASDADLVRVQHVSMRASGVDMGGPLVFARSSLPKIVDALATQVANDRHPDQDFVVGHDDISVFGSGHEMEPFVNITVRRNKDVPGGGLYSLIMSVGCAEQLVAKLRAL